VPDGPLLWLLAFVVGAVVGSFLNVCVYRLPAERSVVSPGSACGACRAPVRWFDNIPIVSWLVLRGRCRACGASISVQYPAVELAVALIFTAAVVRFGIAVEAAHSALLLTLLLGIALTDAREMVIPDQFTVLGAVAGLALAALPGGMPFRHALLGAAVGYGALWAVKLIAEAILRKPALGVGDIHMMAMVGAFLGLGGVLLTILLGSVLGLLIGVPVNWRRGRLEAMNTYLPLGLYLALGAAIAHAWGDAIIDWYLRTILGIA
jgi:leader peptidase (prepilin peptidase)/N-methyltransferase